MSGKSTFIIGFAALTLAATSPAVAQKSKDTLRYPIPEAQTSVDTYLLPGRVSQMWDPSVYDNLFGYDPKERKYAPQLVKSWTQPSPTVYELELRDDVKFHDGEKFDADDVVYTLGYIIDPKVKLRFKEAWSFIQSVEKLGPYKVRFTTKGPAPDGIMQLAFGSPIYPEHYHKTFSNKEDFGTKPIGTGPYRIVQLDKNNGTIAEKNPYFKGYPTKAPAAIRHVISEPIPDIGTWTAKLMAGQADIARDLPIDQAIALQQTGRYKVTLSPPRTAYNFLQFPSAAWKNVKALGDVRVRKAVMMAIDRKTLLEQEYGPLAKDIPPFDGLCKKEQIGCGFTAELVPGYDPAGAKKLLAEAGYADGFDLTISCFNNNVPEATAISGMLRAVGIRAAVAPHQVPLRRQMLAQGKIEMSYYGWTGVMFEVAPHVDRHFLTKEFDDPILVKMAQASLTITDDAERRRKVAEVFDYAIDKAYALPVLPNNVVYTHTKDVKITVPDVRLISVNPHDFAWK